MPSKYEQRSIVASFIAVVTIVYWFFVRPWHLRWGTTDEEVDMTLPGDDILRTPESQVTHAITIDAPAETVWPWLVQIGQGRAGFYSYELARKPRRRGYSQRRPDSPRTAGPPRRRYRSTRSRGVSGADARIGSRSGDSRRRAGTGAPTAGTRTAMDVGVRPPTDERRNDAIHRSDAHARERNRSR